jgi:AGZA family xanthine/uracil permease-like MFS transporter
VRERVRAGQRRDRLLFLVAMFFTPLVKIVPFEAASAALVVVGFLMITQIRSIDFTDFGIAIPASSRSC